MKRLWLLTVFCLTSLTFTLPAQQAGTLSINDCVQIALKNNSQLLISGHRLEIARKDEKRSYSNILPSVDVSATGSKFEQGPSSYIGGTFVGDGAIAGSNGVNYNATLSINQTIYDGGFWWNSIRKARSDRAAQEFGYDEQRQATIVRVQEAYLNLLKAKKLLEVNEQAVKRSEEQLQRSESLFKLGSVAKVDVYQSQVNLGNDRINYLRQKNAVQQSGIDLNIAMGRDPLEELNIQVDDETAGESGKVEDLIDTAIKNSPVLKQQQLLYRSAQFQSKIAKSTFLPQVGTFFNYSRRVPELSGLYENFNNEFSWSLGLSVRWNLFNGFSDFHNAQAARLAEKINREETLVQRNSVVGTVKALHNDLTALKEIVEINKTNLESAMEEYRLASERYRVGAGTSLELREAQVKLTTAEQVLVAAKYDVLTTSARLQQATGKL